MEEAPDPKPRPASAPRAARAGRGLAGVKLPITATLLAGFGGLVAVAVATVLLISIRVARENTDQLLTQAATQRLDAAVARIDRYLAPAGDAVAFIADRLSRDDSLRLDEARPIATLMQGALGPAPQITALTFLRPDLTSVRTRRGIAAGGDDVDRIFDNLAVETRARELLEAAKRAKGVEWNPVFFVPGLPGSFVSAMAPVRRGGEFDGIVIAAVPVSALSRLIEDESGGCLQQSAETSRLASCMFILNASDGVVAHFSIARGDFTPTADHALPQRMELSDPVMQALWSARGEGSLMDRHLQGTRSWTRRIDVNGQTYYVLLRLVQGYSPQPWTVGIYFQATQIAGPLLQLRFALALGLLILAAAVAAALLLGLGLARPIRRLALAAEAVSAFDFSGSRRLGASPLKELDSAGRAWDGMLAALRWFEIYVPKALVGRLLREAEQQDLKAEEREVTVMFTDIVGFSRIALRHTPTSLSAFLNRHFGLIGRHVEAEQGTIDKYIGDSVMAFWGAPAADADHARHAARAALAIAATLAADNRRRARKNLAPVRIRIGLHSGPAVVGNVGAPGRVNYTLIGDTVNAAQRLEQLGKSFGDGGNDCTILASAALVAHLPDDIPRTALGDHTLRGMGIFEVYRLGSAGESAVPSASAAAAS